ncbi:glutaredoxin family protein [Synechococcus sp. RSCCF101]|uniref:MauE/DoxX family redox-associated membrane protein n=1 Tax=Synechococcus sp. RSCCF101 TaxID=2511069 RepID=UPI0012482B24|nr:glutaredoxin [Synechococcus sp. RSCCF101]QEY31123.1 glutaredoxin family protein [Synechococcus sp. RSCCF101]
MASKARLTDVHVYRMDTPEHSCPWGLKAIRLLQEQHIPFDDHRLTSQAAVDRFKADHAVATTPQVFAGSTRIGGYTDLAAHLGVSPERPDVSYWPVVAVFGTALLITLAMGGSVRTFMGIALALLAMLKLMDVPSFAASFIKYDLISQRIPVYARIYPALELLIGLGFLLTPPIPAAGVVALLLGVAGMVAVFKAVVVDKLALNCACVGGNTRTPLGVVSFSENLMMAVMGAVVASALLR